MRYTIHTLAAAALLAACGGGGAATGPTDGSGDAGASFSTLELTPPAASVAVGARLQLTAAPRDAAGNAVAGLPAPSWQSADPSVASVSADGMVTGVAPGSTRITASLTAGGVTRSAVAEVAVTAGFASVRLSPAEATVAAGATLQLTATALDAAGNALSGAPAASWQSDAPAVASVSGGLVTAHAAGTARVTVTLTHLGATHPATATITVPPPAAPSAATVQGIDHGFSPATVTIAAGGSVTWAMAGDRHDVTWDGAAPTGGNIPRLEEGSSASRAFPTPGIYTYHCAHHDSRVEAGTVVVQAAGGAAPVLSSVRVAPDPAAVAVGGTVQLSATARDQHGNPMPGVAVATWRSADPARATVSADGRVTGVSAGATTVTATVTHEGKTVSGSGAVQVGAVAQPSTATVTATADRTFSPSRVTIAAGGTVTWQFSATHNVTFSGAAPAGGSIANSGGGTSASRQFATPGTYGYECTLHSGMTGTVVVQ